MRRGKWPARELPERHVAGGLHRRCIMLFEETCRKATELTRVTTRVCQVKKKRCVFPFYSKKNTENRILINLSDSTTSLTWLGPWNPLGKQVACGKSEGRRIYNTSFCKRKKLLFPLIITTKRQIQIN